MKNKNPGRFVSNSLQAKRFGRAMITPTLIVMAVMTAYPLIFTVYYSFTDYNLLGVLKNPAKFIGLKNYVKLLGNEYFRKAIWNTVKFTIFAVIGTFSLVPATIRLPVMVTLSTLSPVARPAT